MSELNFAIEGLEITEAFKQGFAKDGITLPTTVQEAAIPPILAGHSVIIHSGTGTGKTLAYLLPILQKLRQQASGRTVIFAPAAELAMQTLRTADRYKEPTISTSSLVATGSIRQQKARVQQSTRLIVGTTKRILELYAEKKLKGVTTVVLDEPDPILATPGSEYLREILSRPDPKVQLIFAAATLGDRAERLAREIMGENAVRTVVTDNPLKSQISHSFVRVRDEGTRDRDLSRFIEAEKCKRAIVFVNQPHVLRHLYRYLSEDGMKVVSLSHDRPKHECQKALRAFQSAEAKVLVTTDVAMRGMDIPNVAWVLHYELPSSAPAYVHRAGRTGRAGKAGRSVLFVNERELRIVNHFGRDLDLEFVPHSRDKEKPVSR